MTLSKEKQVELQGAFEYSDSDGDGLINFLEFVNLLEDYGVFIDTAGAQAGFDELDKDDDGMIGFEEFASWWREN